MYVAPSEVDFAHVKPLRIWEVLQYDGVYVRLMPEYYEHTHMYYMHADGADKGIIPLTCSELFTRVDEKKAADPNVNFTVEVSYIEVRVEL